MSHDLNMLRAKVRKSLDNVGKTNGTTCPPTKSNTDPVLHELYIANEIVSYGKVRYEKARGEALRAAFDPGQLEAVVTRVIKNDAGESVLGAEGEVYGFVVDIARSATRVDMTALTNYLMTKCGLTKTQIDKALGAATKKSAPAKRAKVITR